MVAKQHHEEDVPEIDEITAGSQRRKERQLGVVSKEEAAEQRGIAEESNRIVVGGVAEPKQPHTRIKNVCNEGRGEQLQAYVSQHTV